MILNATLETTETGVFATTELECKDYYAGFQQLRTNVPEGQRLISVRVQRS